MVLDYTELIKEMLSKFSHDERKMQKSKLSETKVKEKFPNSLWQT